MQLLIFSYYFEISFLAEVVKWIYIFASQSLKLTQKPQFLLFRQIKKKNYFYKHMFSNISKWTDFLHIINSVILSSYFRHCFDEKSSYLYILPAQTITVISKNDVLTIWLSNFSHSSFSFSSLNISRSLTPLGLIW